MQSVAGSRRLYLRPDPDHGHRHLTEGQRHNNLKSYSNRGIDHRYCVSYYRGRDKKKVKKNGETIEVESEIDLIIEENGVLYPIEIKQGTNGSADEASAFPVLDKVSEKSAEPGPSYVPAPPLGCSEIVCFKSLCGISDLPPFVAASSTNYCSHYGF